MYRRIFLNYLYRTFLRFLVQTHSAGLHCFLSDPCVLMKKSEGSSGSIKVLHTHKKLLENSQKQAPCASIPFSSIQALFCAFHVMCEQLRCYPIHFCTFFLSMPTKKNSIRNFRLLDFFLSLVLTEKNCIILGVFFPALYTCKCNFVPTDHFQMKIH